MLTVVRQIKIDAPRETVSAYLKDIRHLADYEQKVEGCRVSYPDDRTALAAVEGSYMGLKWKGVFEMRWTADGGFTSRMTRGPLKDMSGGFSLLERGGSTWLTHHECYGFPWPVRLLYPVIRPWLARSMEIELAVIKKAVEARRPAAVAA